MKCGLYTNSKGDIAFRTEALLNEKGERGVRYLNEVYGVNPKDIEWVPTEMHLLSTRRLSNS
jgi:hypothetical protein